MISGPILDAAVFAHYRAIARMLELGVNVISDQVLWSRDWLLDAVQVFEPFRAFMVGVFVSGEEPERRHVARGRSGAGWHRGSARLTYEGALYDLKVETTNQTPQSCATEVKASLDAGLEPGAFAKMRRKLVGIANNR